MRSQRFALIELILIVLCGAIWMVRPESGIWFILIALLPLALRLTSTSYQFSWVDLCVLIFAATAWVGYWAAYDQITAWRKVWWIMTAVMLYFSLKTQPRENMIWISSLLFFIGVGVSLHYFLTYDFIATPRKLETVNSIGRWIMTVRPQTSWISIHPNYVAGMGAITIPFILYPVLEFKKNSRVLPGFVWMLIIIGLGIVGFALVMATSRGVVLAIVSGLGGWSVWRFVTSSGIRRRIKGEAVFPILLLIYLCVIVTFLYIGPARSGSLFTGNYYGNGSRAELFSRSVYLLFAFPFTGGGLGSFPGLYSQYLLGIPFFNVPNSHNLFLDVGIEQGLFGGLSFLVLYLASIWFVSSSLIQDQDDPIFNQIILFSLIVAVIHGMVDDYLYNGVGTMLSLLLVGLVMNSRLTSVEPSARRLDARVIAGLAIICVIVIAVNSNQIRGIWYANLGAVEMAKVELKGYPNNGWAGHELVSKMDDAVASLHSSLQFDPANRTANQRLGLILMLGRDFESAVHGLEIAHDQAPNHRGIIKSLGYCYVWLGETGKAQELLVYIPEAKEELGVYTWWWKTQGRSDLSVMASTALEVLK